MGRALVAGLALALFLFAPSLAGAQALPVASDGEYLWRAAYDEENHRTVIYHHHRANAQDDRLRRVTSLAGRLTPMAMTASGGGLWLFFQDGSVQRVEARQADNAWGVRFETRIVAPLPSGVIPTAVAAHQGRAWALVRVEQIEALRKLDRDASTAAADAPGDAGGRAAVRDRARRIALGLPPEPAKRNPAAKTVPSRPDDADDTDDAEAGAAAEPPDAAGSRGEADGEANGDPNAVADAASDRPALPQHRLIRERGSRWEAVALPDAWPHMAWADLVFEKPEAVRPTLVAAIDGKLQVFRHREGRWREQSIEESDPSSFRQAIRVEGQLVLARTDPASSGSADRLTLDFRIVRPDHSARFQGTLDGHASDPWRVGPWGGGVGLFAAPRKSPAPLPADEPSPNASPFTQQAQPPSATPVTLKAVSLRGETLTEPRTLEPTAVSPWEGRADYMLLIGVMVVAVSLTLMSWRQAARFEQLDIEGAEPADLLRRFSAAAVDLAVPGLIVMAVFGMGPIELSERWPPQPEGLTWTQMIPVGCLVALFLLHTIISEAITGRSLGKLLLGLAVCDYRGETPSFARTAGRGVLKVLDLVLWMLIILAIVTPARQRLGDLVAGTLVVMPRKNDPESESDAS